MPQRGKLRNGTHSQRTRKARGGGMSYRYSLAIINDTECPEPKMVALVREADGVREWTYLSASKRHEGSRWLGWNRVRFPDDLTSIEAFGVRPVFELINGKHVMGVEHVGDSVATYRDGKARRWQGRGDKTVVRSNLLPALKEWQRSAPANSQGASA